MDADLRRPRVASLLGLPVDYGLVDYLEGFGSVEDTLINPGFQRLVVLPGQDCSKYSSELLASSTFNAHVGTNKPHWFDPKQV